MACFIWNLEKVLGKAASQLPFCTGVLLMDLNYLVVLLFPKMFPGVKKPKEHFCQGSLDTWHTSEEMFPSISPSCFWVSLFLPSKMTHCAFSFCPHNFEGHQEE